MSYFPCCTQIGAPKCCEPTTIENVGDGVDFYVAGTSGPHEIRRATNLVDGSLVNGLGNLAFWQNGDTIEIGLPKSVFQGNPTTSTNNVVATLAEFTWPPAASGTSGIDNELWMVWWSCKVSGDIGQPLTEATTSLQAHNGAWNTIDTTTTRWNTNAPPGSPICRPFGMFNTNWSANAGLRMRIICNTDSAFVFNEWTDPVMYIQRHSRAP